MGCSQGKPAVVESTTTPKRLSRTSDIDGDHQRTNHDARKPTLFTKIDGRTFVVQSTEENLIALEVYPSPGFVIKSTRQDGGKVFINAWTDPSSLKPYVLQKEDNCVDKKGMKSPLFHVLNSSKIMTIDATERDKVKLLFI